MNNLWAFPSDVSGFNFYLKVNLGKSCHATSSASGLLLENFLLLHFFAISDMSVNDMQHE